MATRTPPSTPAEFAAFLQQLRDQVLDEADTARRQIRQLWSRPLHERVTLGRAIAGIRVVRLHPNGLVELACERNESRFRVGDSLSLNRASPLAEPQLSVTLEHDDETRLLVATDAEEGALGELARTPEGWVLDESLHDASPFVLGALFQAGETVVGRERVLPLLLGRARPTVDSLRYARGLELGAAAGLNDQQQEALAQAYATNLAYLIQGPPGTGKTAVLAHLAATLAQDGERVLVTALTHRAINNALNTLVRLAPETSVVKIGQETRADDLRADNYGSFASCPLAASADGYVIGATPFATRTARLRGVEFDTVIFDEASQITLPLAVMGMLVGTKYIFIGDHRQLPPVRLLRDEACATPASIFANLVERGFDTLLIDTYRMNAELTAWPSAHFYEGLLRPANAATARQRVRYQRPPARLAEALDREAPLVFLDVGHRNATTRSHSEAGAVADLVVTLLEAGVPPQEIGIIAPYRAQGRAIRNLLGRALPEADRAALIVDTVERMQGQERMVVIVSLTSSHPEFAASMADFLLQAERLNVAVTRARAKLILVGSRQLLDVQPGSASGQLAIERLRDLVRQSAYRTLHYGEGR
jgi:DNA replication ATP-dependent helicase Dna2